VSSNAWTRNNLVNDDDVITSAAKILKILFYASIGGGSRDSPDVIAVEQGLKDDDTGSLQHILPVSKVTPPTGVQSSNCVTHNYPKLRQLPLR